MKLNPNCVRDVMLTLEDATRVIYLECGGKSCLSFAGVSYLSIIKTERLRGTYSIEDVVYTLIQLAESDYIKMPFSYDEKHYSLDLGKIFYITPKGHDFLSAISEGKAWKNKIIPALSAIGNVSLSVIEAIAKGVAGAKIDNVIQAHLG